MPVSRDREISIVVAFWKRMIQSYHYNVYHVLAYFYWLMFRSQIHTTNFNVNILLGICLEVDKEEVINHSCKSFSYGCPDTHFFDYEIYKCK